MNGLSPEIKEQFLEVLKTNEAASFVAFRNGDLSTYRIQVSPKYKTPMASYTGEVLLPVEALDYDEKKFWYIVFHEEYHFRNKEFLTTNQMIRGLFLKIFNRVEAEEVRADKYAQALIGFTQEDLEEYLYDIYSPFLNDEKSRKMAKGRAKQCFR